MKQNPSAKLIIDTELALTKGFQVTNPNLQKQFNVKAIEYMEYNESRALKLESKVDALCVITGFEFLLIFLCVMARRKS